MNSVATADESDTAPEISAMSGQQLAAYVRERLQLALSLASNGEQERRSGRWESAERRQREWAVVMDEVRRLLPLVRKSGVPLFKSAKGEQPRSRRSGRSGLSSAL
jgi:hypothetical protein